MKIRALFLLSLFFWPFALQAQSYVKPLWRKDVKNSLNSINKATGMKMDDKGNIYLLGVTWIPDSAKDILLIRFNEAGHEVWHRMYDNPAHGDDIPQKLGIDSEGNPWVCGMAKLKPNESDFLVVKFSPEGVPVSDDFYAGKDKLFDCATAIASAKSGMYAAGYETSIDSGINMVVAKYSPEGNREWHRKFSTIQMDIANQLFVDDSSNVYVCGTSNSGPRTSDILLIKYNAEGILQWKIQYDGTYAQKDAGSHIAADDSMNIYVSGFLNHSNSRADIPILKINRYGKIIRDVTFNGLVSDCGSVHLNPSDRSVFLTGKCHDYSVGSTASFLVEFDKANNQKNLVSAPAGVNLFKSHETDSGVLVFGSSATPYEGIFTTFIGLVDSSSFVWTYSDSTIVGLTNIIDAEIRGNEVYFLADDAGDASGTISLIKYYLTPSHANDKRKGGKD